MSISHGKSAVLKIDATAGGALTDYSAYLNSVTFTPKADVAETSVFAVASKQFIAGLKDCTLSIKGPYQSVIVAVCESSRGAAVTSSFEFDPQGTASGTDRWTGEMYCTSIGATTDMGGAAMFTAEFQVSGNITLGSN